MMKFNAGERVAVYSAREGGRRPARETGEVREVYEDGEIRVRIDGAKGDVRAHSKQCRRLTKKPRRRIWLPESELFSAEQAIRKGGAGGPEWEAVNLSFRKMTDDDVEFVEVRRKR